MKYSEVNFSPNHYYSTSFVVWGRAKSDSEVAFYKLNITLIFDRLGDKLHKKVFQNIDLC